MTSHKSGPFQQRRAGVLLHPTSLPGSRACGDIGPEAYRFIDFLSAGGQSVWQMLPLGPTHDDGSPYQCLSAYAGNPALISFERMVQDGWLGAEDVRASDDAAQRHVLMEKACANFRKGADSRARAAYKDFVVAEHAWLEDYALYRALRDEYRHAGWTDWPAGLRDRKPEALAEARARLQTCIDIIMFEQFVFFRQWAALKHYANGHGVLLFGDLPIFIAHDSADVWAQREYFELDAAGHPTVVAGVPPDYFSETGQRWGNPHYRWPHMEQEGFRWWIRRLEMQLRMFDIVRIDHFRGFEAYWEIPADHETAIHGHWVQAPGDALFNTLHQHFDPLPVVAEDLGLITEEVLALREKYGLPGMRVLQFAFDSNPRNPHLPHNYETNTVVYTGTHDNDTTLGWYESLSAHNREYLHDYVGLQGQPMPWPLIRTAYSSVARLAIVPMQDVLSLGGEHRMNVPGVKEGNWRWRFDWSQVTEDLALHLNQLAGFYGRLPE